MNAPISMRHASDFAHMYAENFAFVWRVLRRLGVEPDALDDRAQDVFLVAHRRWSQFERRSSDRTWLYGIARRVAADHRRGRVRRIRRRRALAQTRALQSPGQRDSTDALLFLDAFLEELSPDLREAFVLFELEGLSGNEAAELTGVNTNTLYARRRKAKLSFQARLGSDRVQSHHLQRIAKAHQPDAGAEARVASALPFLGLSYFELVGKSSTTTSSVTTQVGWLSWPSLKFVAAGAVLAAGVLVLAPTPNAELARSQASVHEDISAAVRPAAEPAAAPPPAATVVQAPTPTKPPVHPQSAKLADRARSAAVTAAEPSHAPAGTGSLGEQTRQHQAARTALREGRFTEALEAASSYLQRWPAGPFATASRVLRIEALCASGQPRQARGEAGRLKLQGADSATLASIERTCAGSGAD